MKFILSLLSLYYVLGMPDIFCVYQEANNIASTCSSTPKGCEKISGGCVVTVTGTSTGKSVKYNTGSYYEYSSNNCKTMTDNNKVTYPSTAVDCQSILNVTYAVKQEIAPTKLCYYNYSSTGCGDANLVSCADSSNTCVKFGDKKYVKITDFKVQAYSDKSCKTPISSAVSATIVRGTDCEQAGTQNVYAKGVTTLTTKSTAADYLCAYSDKDCKMVDKCSKTVDGCKMIKTGWYAKRNIYTNMIEVHSTATCDDYIYVTTSAVGKSCAKVGSSTHYVKFSSTVVTNPSVSLFNLSYFTLAIIAIIVLFE
eukprot:GHVR01174703.1.p1 GENE.GHVR01174703.1~~GHVR01174703.1.p1  ORF type:complete len:319 (+),score=8.48 GHVR01174703.1:29-958(+)